MKSILYLLSSVVTGSLYLGLLFISREFFNLNSFTSVSLAYGFSMIFYFVTNKLMVFRKKGSGDVKRELSQFILLISINYVLTLLIVAAVRLFTGEIYFGSLLAGVVTVSLTYLVFDRILFKKT